MSKVLFPSPVSPVCIAVGRILVAVLILANLVHSGDPCPQKELLAPCTCSHVNLGLMQPRIAGMEISVTTPMTINSDSGFSTLTRSLMIPRSAGNAGEATNLPPPPRNSSFYTVVTCNAPKTQYIMEEALAKALHRLSVDKLSVSNIPPKKEYTQVQFPPELLLNFRIKQFEVRNTVLSGDFISYNSPFRGQEQSMIWFTAQNCYLSGALSYDTAGNVLTRGLNSMPRIEGVDLSKNHLSFISALAFRYPPANLSTINLSYNSINAIEGGAFANVPGLRHIDLSSNLLTSVARAYFSSPAHFLEHINFSSNRMSSLPVDFLTNMPRLKVVNMSYNFLYSMPDKPWSPVWKQLTFVDVSRNFIDCDCSLMWLLPILSPPDVNSTTTPVPTPLPGQTILGWCSQTHPLLITRNRVLRSLKRSELNC